MIASGEQNLCHWWRAGTKDYSDVDDGSSGGSSVGVGIKMATKCVGELEVTLHLDFG